MAQRYVNGLREAYRNVRKDIKGVFGSIFPEAVRLAAERIAHHHPYLSGDVIYRDMLRRFRFYVEPIPHDKLAHVDVEKEHVILNLRPLRDFVEVDGHRYKFVKRHEGHRLSRIRDIIRESIAYELVRWHITGSENKEDSSPSEKVAASSRSVNVEDTGLSRGLEFALLITPILLLATAAFNITSVMEKNVTGMMVSTASSVIGAFFLFASVLIVAHVLSRE